MDDVDIPEPEEAANGEARPRPDVDPGSDESLPDPELGLGEDPAYDPGGLGRQPDISEDADEHSE